MADPALLRLSIETLKQDRYGQNPGANKQTAEWGPLFADQ